MSPQTPPILESRVKGAIWGTCVGDALGGPVQFEKMGKFEPIEDLQPVWPFGMPAGAYSDDGSMTLALAQSFVDCCGEYDQDTAVQHYISWMNNGRFSTCGWAWDMGISTGQALTLWTNNGIQRETQELIIRKLDKEMSSGNGSLMRIAPVGVMFWNDEERCAEAARVESMSTHPALACVEACVLFTSLIAAAMQGKTKDEIFWIFREKPPNLTHPSLRERLSPYSSLDSWILKEPPQMRSSGWVVDTLEVALWGFFKFGSWKDGALAVVNLGGDSDTAGAIYGALAGVFYGFEAIPEEWVERMQRPDCIDQVATDFVKQVSKTPCRLRHC